MPDKKKGWSTAESNQLATRIAYDIQGRQEYIGETWPEYQSRLTSEVWRIKRLYYDEEDRLIAVIWAGRSNEFKFSWALRTTYSYLN